jgi:hypothetical protein
VPVVLAIIALQIVCAIHCARSGRSSVWVMVIIFFPVAGSLAYVVMEVLPGSGMNRTARKARAKVAEKLDPERPLREAREAGFAAMPAADVADALRWIARHADRDHPPVVLIMGSLYLAGEVLQANGESPD